MLLLGMGTVSAVPLPGQYSFGEYEVAPLDYDVVPIYDGTEIREITGWLNLVYWKDLMFIHIGHFFDETPYGEFVGTTIFPIASSLLGLCFFVIFSRRNTPDPDPESTAAKILQYLDEHPGSRHQQIVAGIGKSRGTVAYHLHRLELKKNLTAVKIHNSVTYYPKDTDKDALITAVQRALQNPPQQEILSILHQYPQITRYRIASELHKSPDTISWHLINLDTRILTIRKQTDGHLYALSPEAEKIYTRLTNTLTT
ncbi:MAG: hypothetical protein O0X96_00665 [Methanocorpusculum sp.]|nr:hypothetical protein [Methanocorpusculum sp.]